ncbi:hypothetical protein IE81DRAFT_231805 [Ceraceosorus guamensis]|uniref:Uncharacterized protein n=1 Tax=Ceraceosorus guamensis TaxID=1522189 RepID=A0A316VY02_9BASI|nr:hypothetical protein IE81DRAFT_231805 [Ceraceosorus guamensis]PWN40355.1 hypothetical protein IE81DRAFT_231805 [Ceraceosorus guamensis]
MPASTPLRITRSKRDPHRGSVDAISSRTIAVGGASKHELSFAPFSSPSSIYLSHSLQKVPLLLLPPPAPPANPDRCCLAFAPNSYPHCPGPPVSRFSLPVSDPYSNLPQYPRHPLLCPCPHLFLKYTKHHLSFSFAKFAIPPHSLSLSFSTRLELCTARLLFHAFAYPNVDRCMLCSTCCRLSERARKAACMAAHERREGREGERIARTHAHARTRREERNVGGPF